jgi:hypothetical protein
MQTSIKLIVDGVYIKDGKETLHLRALRDTYDDTSALMVMTLSDPKAQGQFKMNDILAIELKP